MSQTTFIGSRIRTGRYRGTKVHIVEAMAFPVVMYGCESWSSSVGPGKSSLPFELRGRVGDCSRVTAGKKRPHLGLCPGPNVSLQGRQGSPVRISDSPEESGLASRHRTGEVILQKSLGENRG